MRERGLEVSKRVREAIDICAAFANSCTGGGCETVASAAIRTLMELVIEIDQIRWADVARAEAIIAGGAA